MTMVHFNVIGTPAPQGSKVNKGKGRMVESSKLLPSWRLACTEVAKRHADEHGQLDKGPSGAVRLDVIFRLRRPPSWPKKRGNWHTGKPDKDKLLRALGDSLTDSGLIVDDSRIVVGVNVKIATTEWTGCEIWLTDEVPANFNGFELELK